MTPTPHPDQPHSQGAQPLKLTPGRRYLALDYGSQRVGVAVSDELGMYAHPRPAISGLSDDALLSRIATIVDEEQVGAVVVGLPISLSGLASAQTNEVRDFVSRLRSLLTIPVIEADERLSSTQAAGALQGREKKRSGQRDSAAAAIVLQSLLDARRGASSQ